MQIGNTAQITLFSLILMRMSGFIFMNPILGRKNIPARAKAAFAFILTVTLYSSSSGEAFVIENSLVYGFLLLKEFAAGFVLGLVIDLFMMVFNFGGYVIDYQMGLSMSTVFDPQSNAQMPIMGSIYQTYFMLLFFAVDGHLALMKILLTSAEIVPYGGILITQNTAARVIEIFLECMEFGIRFAMPLLAAEFLVEMGIGILNKVVPQISIFIINLELKLIVGLGILVILFSPMSEFLDKVMVEMMKTLRGILTFL